VCFDLASLDLVYQNRLISRKTYQQIKGAIKYNKSTIELLFAGKISEEDIKALSYEQGLQVFGKFKL
jgi:copper homeostasis protein CutC